jgi:hypothetical protein
MTEAGPNAPRYRRTTSSIEGRRSSLPPVQDSIVAYFACPAGAPDSTRRQLNERNVDAGGVANRLGVVAQAAVDEPPAELTCSERPVGEQRANRLPELFRVDAAHSPAERAVVRALDRGLHERPEENGVAHRDEMHGSAHQRQTDRLLLGEHPAQLVRIEPLEARPEPVVRRHRRLCLKPHEVLDGVADGHVDTAQQVLPREQRPV